MENFKDETLADDGEGWMGLARANVVLVGPSSEVFRGLADTEM